MQLRRVYFFLLLTRHLIASHASRKASEICDSPPLNHHPHFKVFDKRLRSERLASSSHQGQRKFWAPTYRAPFRSHLWSLRTVSFLSLHSSSGPSLMEYLGLFINIVMPAQSPAGTTLPVVFVGCLVSEPYSLRLNRSLVDLRWQVGLYR